MQSKERALRRGHTAAYLWPTCWNDHKLRSPSAGAVIGITLECRAHTRKGRPAQTRRGGRPGTAGGDVSEASGSCAERVAGPPARTEAEAT